MKWLESTERVNFSTQALTPAPCQSKYKGYKRVTTLHYDQS